MTQKLLQAGDTPRLMIEKVEGNLVIRGWERPEVLINYNDEEALTVNQNETQIALRCSDDCSIQAPHGAEVYVQRAEGDSQIFGLHGGIQLQTVEGNLQLREVGSVNLERVEGDLLAKDVHGDLRITHLEGNATIGDVHGIFEV